MWTTPVPLGSAWNGRGRVEPTRLLPAVTARLGSDWPGERWATRRRWKLDARDESRVFKESRDTSKSAGIQQPITAANKYFLLTTVCFATPSDGRWETAERQQQQQQLADK